MKLRILLLTVFMTVGLLSVTSVNTQPVNCQFRVDGECGCRMWPEGNMYECWGSTHDTASLGVCQCAPPWET